MKLIARLRRAGVGAFINYIYPLIIKNREKKTGEKEKITVVFFAMSMAMWNYQGVYDLLSKDIRFNCYIVLTGARQFFKEQRHRELEILRDYFKSKKIDFIDFDEIKDEGYDVKGLINPDILFYPQPYEGQYVKEHGFWIFRDKLFCYVAYGISVMSVNDTHWMYDTYIHNFAWKCYYPFQFIKDQAESNARNHARNVVVSGYPNMDRYLSDECVDVWRIKDRTFKRLIWAPHYSIPAENNWITRSNFLWMSDLMLRIAKQYSERLQIAFKPHPWLKTTLYKHPEWGKEKTDKYFDQWDNMSNTFIASDFVDLFKSSDAMIHDSVSFTAEYLFVNKPVAFVTKDLQKLKDDHSEFGHAALSQHYIAQNEEDVYSFINDVVLGGKDTMLSQRTEFFENVLRPHSSSSTSEFIVNDMKQSLGIKE